MCKKLERLIQPGDDNDSILDDVWTYVNKALKEDPILKARLADEGEFQENVQKYGEKQFIDLLKDMAKKKNWEDLLENRTSFLSSDLSALIVLSIGVFLKQIPSDESNPPKSKWSELSKNGAQSS